MREQGITIIGEVELAYQFGKGGCPLQLPVQMVKTTTTTLLGEIMKNHIRKMSLVVENIGTPYTNKQLRR